MGRKDRPLVSCYQCAGIFHCYGTKQPGLQRDEARARAAECNSWRKGKTTDIVTVVGREEGMSRKKAEDLVLKGLAVWEAEKTLRLIEKKVSSKRPRA